MTIMITPILQNGININKMALIQKKHKIMRLKSPKIMGMNNSKREIFISFLMIYLLFLTGCSVDPLEQEIETVDNILIG